MAIVISPESITPPKLARSAVESYVREQKLVDEPENSGILSKIRAGAFVSIKTREGLLRGCIGTIEPVNETLAKEIIRNAVLAASADPRFDQVSESELGNLSYSVDVLHHPEIIDGPEQLDPSRYGVIVSAGRRRGLLLPDLEGIDTVEKQMAAVLRKAGIQPDQQVTIERFTVERFSE